MTVTPIDEVARRMPEQGRIRTGRKSDKGAPQWLKTLRFTSQDQAAIEQIAELYGGEARPWQHQKHMEWDVVTEAKAVPIVLPPDPLSGTPIYEFWLKGGLQRRCDGVTCEVPQGSPDGTVWSETPCICVAKGQLACKPKTRLVVILRDVKFGGSWRLESSGWHAAHELPGMVEMIQNLQGRGQLVAASLRVQERTKVESNFTRHYIVPVLEIDRSVMELVSGQATVGALAPGPSPELPAAPIVSERDDEEVPPTAEILDAEVLDDTQDHAPLAEPDDEPTKATWVGFVQGCKDVADKLRDEDYLATRTKTEARDRLRHGLCLLVSKGRTDSSKSLTDVEVQTAETILSDLWTGDRRLIKDGFTEDGRLRISKRA